MANDPKNNPQKRKIPKTVGQTAIIDNPPAYMPEPFSGSIPALPQEFPLQFQSNQSQIQFENAVLAVINEGIAYGYGVGASKTIAAGAVPTKADISSATTENVTYDSTNKKLIIEVAGDYEASAQGFYPNPTASNKSFQIMIYRNSSLLFFGAAISVASVGTNPVIPARLVTLAVGDVIEIYGQTNSTSTEGMTTSSVMIKKVS